MHPKITSQAGFGEYGFERNWLWNYIYFGAKSDICHHALRQFDLGNVGINDARPINTINISCFEVFTVGDQNQAYAKAYKLLCHARTGTAHTDDADAQFLQKSLHVGAECPHLTIEEVRYVDLLLSQKDKSKADSYDSDSLQRHM